MLTHIKISISLWSGCKGWSQMFVTDSDAADVFKRSQLHAYLGKCRNRSWNNFLEISTNSANLQRNWGWQKGFGWKCSKGQLLQAHFIKESGASARVVNCVAGSRCFASACKLCVHLGFPPLTSIRQRRAVGSGDPINLRLMMTSSEWRNRQNRSKVTLLEGRLTLWSNCQNMMVIIYDNHHVLAAKFLIFTKPNVTVSQQLI